MYTRIYIFIYVHIHTYICISMYIHLNIYLYICIYVFMYIHIYTHTHICTHVYIHIYIQIYALAIFRGLGLKCWVQVSAPVFSSYIFSRSWALRWTKSIQYKLNVFWSTLSRYCMPCGLDLSLSLSVNLGQPSAEQAAFVSAKVLFAGFFSTGIWSNFWIV